MTKAGIDFVFFKKPEFIMTLSFSSNTPKSVSSKIVLSAVNVILIVVSFSILASSIWLIAFPLLEKLNLWTTSFVPSLATIESLLQSIWDFISLPTVPISLKFVPVIVNIPFGFWIFPFW